MGSSDFLKTVHDGERPFLYPTPHPRGWTPAPGSLARLSLPSRAATLKYSPKSGIGTLYTKDDPSLGFRPRRRRPRRRRRPYRAVPTAWDLSAPSLPPNTAEEEPLNSLARRPPARTPAAAAPLHDPARPSSGLCLRSRTDAAPPQPAQAPPPPPAPLSASSRHLGPGTPPTAK